MQISESFRSYDQKTCILVADRLHAKFYLASGREFDCVDEKTNDRLTVGENEHYVGSSGSGQLFQATDEQLDDREAHTFYKTLAATLFTMKQKHQYDKLILVLPHNDKNILVEYLHEDIKQALDFVIGKELTRLSVAQLIEKIDASRG